MAALTISPNDLPNANLQGEIANLDTLIAKADAAGNYPLAALLTGLQSEKQLTLVNSLLAENALAAPGFSQPVLTATLLAGLANGTVTPARILNGEVVNVYYAVPPQFSQGPIPL